MFYYFKMKKNKIVAIVGLCGSGKTIASDFFVKKGYKYIRFGQITLDEVKKRIGLNSDSELEKEIRENTTEIKKLVEEKGRLREHLAEKKAARIRQMQIYVPILLAACDNATMRREVMMVPVILRFGLFALNMFQP